MHFMGIKLFYPEDLVNPIGEQEIWPVYGVQMIRESWYTLPCRCIRLGWKRTTAKKKCLNESFRHSLRAVSFFPKTTLSWRKNGYQVHKLYNLTELKV